MSSIRKDDSATRLRDQIRDEASGRGAAAEAQKHPGGAAEAHARGPDPARAGGADALEAGGEAGFKSRWARELDSKPAAGAQGASQDAHDQQAREASQRVSDILKQELQKRV